MCLLDIMGLLCTGICWNIVYIIFAVGLKARDTWKTGDRLHHFAARIRHMDPDLRAWEQDILGWRCGNITNA